MRRGGSSGRYVQQFQLALLELELTRRHEERRAALRRAAEIEARIGELATAIRARHVALGLGPVAADTAA